MSAAAPLANAVGLSLASAIGLGSICLRTTPSVRVPGSEHDHHGGRMHRRFVPGGRVGRVTTGLIAFSAAAWLAGPVLSAALAIAIAGWLRGVPILRQRHQQQQRVRAVPDALDLVVVLLHAGATPRQTFVELGRRGPRPTQQGFAAVALQLERGQPFQSAIGALRTEVGDAITPFVELLAASERYGLSTAHLVQQLSNETRALRRRQDEAAARSLPVKLSFPLVMCTLPSFVLLAIAPAVLAALSSLGTDAW